jgi:hypothetical protein
LFCAQFLAQLPDDCKGSGFEIAAGSTAATGSESSAIALSRRKGT